MVLILLTRIPPDISFGRRASRIFSMVLDSLLFITLLCNNMFINSEKVIRISVFGSIIFSICPSVYIQNPNNRPRMIFYSIRLIKIKIVVKKMFCLLTKWNHLSNMVRKNPRGLIIIRRKFYKRWESK